MKKLVLLGVSMFLLGACGSNESEEPVAEEESSSAAVSSEVESQSESESVESESSESESSKPEFTTIEEAIEWSGNDVFGDNLREVSYDPETGYIQLDADIEIGGWSVPSSRKEFDKLVVKFMEDIQDDDFTQLNVSGYAKMQDSYGNSEDSDVVRYPISKETVDKIDFENFNVDNLEEVSEGAFIHPEFRE
uniref:hypothetical protein n=1 Tax=Jeotgalibaca porci TaxID=1868793 RepID=UPI0035A04F05